MTIIVRGLDELAAGLDAQFRQLQGGEVKRAMRAALRAGAVMLRDDARRRAPDDTGRLRKSIMVNSGNGHGNVVAWAGVYVKPGPFYWRFQEYGTVKMHAHPFLRPAFDNNIDKIGGVVADKLSLAIEQQLAKR